MWKEYYIYISEFLPLSAGTANALPTALAFSSNTVKIDSDSDFEMRAISFTATDPRIYLKSKDAGSGRFMQKDVVDLRLMGGRSNGSLTTNGVSFLPFKMSGSYIINGKADFTVECADFSGSSNTIRLAFHGSKLRSGEPPWNKKKYRASMGFTYPVIVSLAANATVITSITTDTDSDFIMEKLGARRTGAATVEIKDGRDRRWSNNPVHIDNMFGCEAFQNSISHYQGRFIEAGDSISLQVTDLSGSANVVAFALHGKKLLG